MQRFTIPVDAGVPAGETNTYLVGSPERVLVDPAGRTDDLDRAIAEHRIGHIAVTHTHSDHVSAVEHYAREADATVWTRYGRTDEFERATGIAPDRTFRGGSAIPDTGVSVLDTPGHAPEHVAFVHGEDAITGDLVFAESSVFVGTPEGDMRAYLTSLRRLHARDFDTLYPGHGPPIEHPRERCAELIAHRRDREERVLAAVRAGEETVEAIVDAAYEKDLGGMRDLAARTVRAHLGKLVVEGKVEWDNERARPV